MCVFRLLPATGVAEDYQGIREAVKVVVPEMQGQRLVGFPWYKAPNCFPPLEIRQHCYPLQHHQKKNNTCQSEFIKTPLNTILVKIGDRRRGNDKRRETVDEHW